MNKFKKILITGISGSGGSYLAEYISKNYKKIQIYGISRWHSSFDKKNIKNFNNKIKVFNCDLNDFSSIMNILNKTKPDAIFHLASHANVRASFDTPIAVTNNNINSTLNLLEAIRATKINPVIQLCSTSEVYGKVQKNEIPIKETVPFRPSSPYAVSKLTQDMLGLTYYYSYNLKVIRTRMFSYFNPRREDLFATSFAKQIALIEKGRIKYLSHGNLNSIRTMIDIDDAMRAYCLAITKCKYGEAYNIGGNKIIKVGDFLKKLISLSSKKIVTKLDKKLLRPSDVTLQIPDISKSKKATGFKPEVSFDKSMLNLLNYWREQIGQKYI